MNILEQLIADGWKDTKERFEGCYILLKEGRRTLYDPKNDEFEQSYDGLQPIDMQRLRAV